MGGGAENTQSDRSFARFISAQYLVSLPVSQLESFDMQSRGAQYQILVYIAHITTTDFSAESGIPSTAYSACSLEVSTTLNSCLPFGSDVTWYQGP